MVHDPLKRLIVGNLQDTKTKMQLKNALLNSIDIARLYYINLKITKLSLPPGSFIGEILLKYSSRKDRTDEQSAKVLLI